MGLRETIRKIMCKYISLVKGTIAFLRFSIGPYLPLKKKKKREREILRTLFYTKEIVQPAHQATRALL